MVCAEYNHGARFRFLLSLCVQVVLLAESQGGQVASKLAPLMMPDLLVLLVSLPDDLDIAPLRDARIQTVIGWKVIRLFYLFHLPHALTRAGVGAPMGRTGRRGTGGAGPGPDSLFGWRAQRLLGWSRFFHARRGHYHIFFVAHLAISTMCMQVMRVVGEGVEYVRANGLARVAVAAAGA